MQIQEERKIPLDFQYDIIRYPNFTYSLIHLNYETSFHQRRINLFILTIQNEKGYKFQNINVMNYIVMIVRYPYFILFHKRFLTFILSFLK